MKYVREDEKYVPTKFMSLWSSMWVEIKRVREDHEGVSDGVCELVREPVYEWGSNMWVGMKYACGDRGVVPGGVSLVEYVSECLIKYVIHDTWLMHTWDLTHSYVWHDSFIHETLIIHMYDMTHSYVRHDSLLHTCDLTHSRVRHDPFMYVGPK